MLIFPKYFVERPSQTRLKHGILREYAGAWTGIISTGLQNQARKKPTARDIQFSFVYVDGFAGAGAYQRDAHQNVATGPIWGSPVIGTRQIVERLRGVPLTTSVSAIFCEASPEHHDALLHNLQEAPLGIPYRSIRRVAEAQRGEASVLQADFRSCSGEIARWLGNSYGLVLVDPWGSGMKMRDLAPLVGRKKVDTIILYPATDVKRFGSCASKSRAKLTPNDRSNLTRLNDLFGDERWQAIFADEYLVRPEDRESEALALYVQILTEVDPSLIVKTIRLRNSAVDRTSYYLVLTTRNESGAIRMNSVLRTAEFREHFAVWADYEERERKKAEQHGVLSLGLEDEFVAPPAPPPTEFPASDVGDAIALRCGAGALTLRDIWRRLADDPYTEDEIRKGLRNLKERNQASFDRLRALGDTITLRV